MLHHCADNQSGQIVRAFAITQIIAARAKQVARQRSRCRAIDAGSAAVERCQSDFSGPREVTR